MKRRIVLPAVLLLAAVLGWIALAGSPRQADITLLPEQRFQTMMGWEATADTVNTPTAPPWAAIRDQMLASAVDDIGINRLRLEVRSGAESRTGIIRSYITGKTPYDDWKDTRYSAANDNDDPQVIDPAGFDFAELDWHMQQSVLPMAKRLAARGEKLWVNLCFVSFVKQRTFHNDPEEYAEFVLATYLHLRDRFGFSPDTWEVILEPDKLNAWTGTDIGRAIVAASLRLRANGFTPAFVAPSVLDMRSAVPMLDQLLAVPGARDTLVELSYHRYGGTSPRTLRAIASRAQSLGLRTGMLELWFGKATYPVLFDDLVNGNASAFQGRVLQGLFDLDQGRLGPPREDVRYNAQVYRSVRLGAVRIGAETTASGSFDPVAFVNPTGGQVVAVMAQGAGRITLHGLAPGTYGISYAIAQGSETLPDMIAIDGTISVDMPGKGVVTVAGQ